MSELRPFAADVTWISPTTATAPLRVGAPAGAGEPVTVIEGATVERLEGDRAGAADQMLELAGLFVALPRRARHPQLPGLPEGPLKVDAAGRVAGIPMAWAAGDVRESSSRTVGGAVGDATTVAWDIARNLGIVVA